jgi:hypothetical protein
VQCGARAYPLHMEGYLRWARRVWETVAEVGTPEALRASYLPHSKVPSEDIATEVARIEARFRGICLRPREPRCMGCEDRACHTITGGDALRKTQPPPARLPNARRVS